jgi:hypothetical protein
METSMTTEGGQSCKDAQAAQQFVVTPNRNSAEQNKGAAKWSLNQGIGSFDSWVSFLGAVF